MESFNAENYRDTLAQKLKESPKDKRSGMLDIAQEDPNYWQARQESISERQTESEIDGGLGVEIKHRNLYHGSTKKDIDTFNGADEYTMGHGLYLTSEADKAIGYGRVRAQSTHDEEAKPVIYEAEISNIKLLNLRKTENVNRVSSALRKMFADRLATSMPDTQGSKLFIFSLKRGIAMIDAGEYGHGRIEAIAHYPGLSGIFEDYVKSLGYDGVVGAEGGEGSGDLVVGEHDSYVIFDPKKAKIIREHVTR